MNVEKSKWILIGSLRALHETVDEGASMSLRVNLRSLIRVTEVKFLGVPTRENLTLKQNVKYLIDKIN